MRDNRTEARIREWRWFKVAVYVAFFALGFALTKGMYEQLYLRKFLPAVPVKGVLTRNYRYETVPLNEVMDALEEAETRVYGDKELNFVQREKLLSIIDAEKRKFRSLYPVPSPLRLLAKNVYPEGKFRTFLFVLLEALFVFAPVGGLAYLDRKKLKPFFFQVGKKEEPIKLGEPKELIDWEYFGIKESSVRNFVFKDGSSYEKYLAIYDNQLIYDEVLRSELESRLAEELREKGKVVLDLFGVHRDVKAVLFEGRLLSEAVS